MGISKRQDGRYCSRFTVRGVHYTCYGRTRKECQAAEMLKRKEIEENRYKRGEELTNTEYFERWMENKSDIKETTLRTDRILFKAAAEIVLDKNGQRFGDVLIVNVEPEHIRIVQKGLRETRTTRTTNDCINLLRSMYKDAVNERALTWNPAAGVRGLKRVEEPARETFHRALTREECRRFLETAQEDSAYYNLYLFLLHTGARVGEAAALRPGDFHRDSVQIVRTVTRTEVGGYAIGDDTKTAAGRRMIPLDEAAMQAVKNQKERNRVIYGLNIEDATKPVFRTVTGKLLTATRLNADIDRICKRAGVEHFTAHAFRGTFATLAIDSGMQPKILQEILGHSDISVTMNLYAHAVDDTKRQQLSAVNWG